MTLLTIVYLFVSSLSINPGQAHASLSGMDFPVSINCTPVIDTNDIIVISLDQVVIFGNTVEIPVFIQSDDVINALDFSILLDSSNLEYETVIDHTGNLQYASFFNPNDLKLRFTSNSFSSYPVDPDKVISVRFKVLSDLLKLADFQMLTGYLNGERCKIEIQSQGDEIPVSNKEIITNEIFMTPNPVTDMMYIQADEQGSLDMYDLQGHQVISGTRLTGGEINSINVQHLPRGSYTVRIISSDHKVKTQQILLQ